MLDWLSEWWLSGSLNWMGMQFQHWWIISSIKQKMPRRTRFQTSSFKMKTKDNNYCENCKGAGERGRERTCLFKFFRLPSQTECRLQRIMRNRSYKGRERREIWDKELGRRKGRDEEGESLMGREGERLSLWRHRWIGLQHQCLVWNKNSRDVELAKHVEKEWNMSFSEPVCQTRLSLVPVQGILFGQKRMCFCFKKALWAS